MNIVNYLKKGLDIANNFQGQLSKKEKLAGIGALSVMYMLYYVHKNRIEAEDMEEHPEKYKELEEAKLKRSKFFRQLKFLLKIVFPSLYSKESGLLVAHTVVLLVKTFLSLYVAHLDGQIVKALVDRNGKTFLWKLFLWLAVAVPACYLISLIQYLEKSLSVSLRTRLTLYAYDLYMKGQTYYAVANLDSRLTNADQSLTEDIKNFSDTLAHVHSQISKPVLDIVLNVWELSNIAASNSHGNGLPSLLIGSIVMYSTGLLLKWIRPRFGKLVAEQAELEGKLRFAHSRIITNSEEIAFLKGEKVELSILEESYIGLVKHTNKLFKSRILYIAMEQMLMKYWWSATGTILMAIPAFLYERQADDVSSEQVSHRTESYITTKNLLIFGANAVERIMLAYKEISELAGYTDRVATLINVFEDCTKGIYKKNKKIKEVERKGVLQTGADYIKFENVPIVTPIGDVLVKNMNFEIHKGQNLLICGPNGCGKCFAPGTLVMAYDGRLIAVENLRADGEVLLMGDDGTPRRILETHTGVGRMFSIAPKTEGDFVDFIANGDHILCLTLSSSCENPAIFSSCNAVTAASEIFVRWLEKDGDSQQASTKESIVVGKSIPFGSLEDATAFKLQLIAKQRALVRHGEIVELSVFNFLELPSWAQSSLHSFRAHLEFSAMAQQIIPTLPSPTFFVEEMANGSDGCRFQVPDRYLCETHFVRLFALASLMESDHCSHFDGQSSSFSLDFEADRVDKEFLKRMEILLRSLCLDPSCCISPDGKLWTITVDDIPNKALVVDLNKILKHKHIRQENSVTVAAIESSLDMRCHSEISVVEVARNGRYHGFSVDGNQRFLLGDLTVVHNSSLFRILGELWPVYGGKVTKPNLSNMFYIPQRPYLVLGTLRDQIIYPDTHDDMNAKGVSDKELLEICIAADLGPVVEKEGFDCVKEWKDTLSGGEKQRIGLARLFYHSPAFAILDECTSALSLDCEARVYEHAQKLGITLITVTHRPSLWKYHNYLLQYHDGTASFSPLDASQRETLKDEKSKLEEKLSNLAKTEQRLKTINEMLGEKDDPDDSSKTSVVDFE